MCGGFVLLSKLHCSSLARPQHAGRHQLLLRHMVFRATVCVADWIRYDADPVARRGSLPLVQETRGVSTQVESIPEDSWSADVVAPERAQIDPYGSWSPGGAV